jgi:hypothetical protein
MYGTKTLLIGVDYTYVANSVEFKIYNSLKL